MTKENYNMHILFGMNGGMVTDTVINGEIRMRNREVHELMKRKFGMMRKRKHNLSGNE